MYSTLSRVKGFQLLVLVLCSAVLAYSQSASTSLRGTILDLNGAVVPDAEIALSNPEIGANLFTRSDKNGFYQFQDVRPRTYILTVTAKGFATFKQDGLVLLISTPATRDVQLRIATETTTVEVQSGLEVINAQDATLGATFDSKQILAFSACNPVLPTPATIPT
jgi:hypothetical protein